MFDGLFQPTHLILILIIVLIVFGPGKLPEVGKALGRGIREFKKATTDVTQEAMSALEQESKQTPQPAQSAAGTMAAENAPVASSPIAGAVSGKLCPKCSLINPSGNKFCGGCGAELPTI